MIYDTEAIYAALFALVSNTSVYPWKTSARRLKLWGEVLPEQRPALYQFEGGDEDYEWRQSTAEPVVKLWAKLFIYTNAKDPAVAGATQINQIMTALNVGFTPTGRDKAFGRLTLGGLVYYARIEGKVFRDPGDLDGDGMLVVPIGIRVNA